jgi:hypothetical protein
MWSQSITGKMKSVTLNFIDKLEKVSFCIIEKAV